MPFFDDTGLNVNTSERSTLWSVFAIIRDQLERLILLNIIWAVQSIPLLVGLGWPEMPTVLRLILVIYSTLIYAPATVVLYGMVWLAAHGETLFAHHAVDLLRATWLKSLKGFMPLIGLFGTLLVLSATPSIIVSAVGQLLFLLLLVCSNYWCVLITAKKYADPLRVLVASVRIVWKYPAQSLVLSGAVLLAVVLGTISIGGWILIVPVVIALLQIQMYRNLVET